jgi:hypothetical protein
VLADGANGHAEFVRRCRKGAQSSRRFSGAQTIEVNPIERLHAVFLNLIAERIECESAESKVSCKKTSVDR